MGVEVGFVDLNATLRGNTGRICRSNHLGLQVYVDDTASISLLCLAISFVRSHFEKL